MSISQIVRSPSHKLFMPKHFRPRLSLAYNNINYPEAFVVKSTSFNVIESIFNFLQSIMSCQRKACKGIVAHFMKVIRLSMSRRNRHIKNKKCGLWRKKRKRVMNTITSTTKPTFTTSNTAANQMRNVKIEHTMQRRDRFNWHMTEQKFLEMSTSHQQS